MLYETTRANVLYRKSGQFERKGDKKHGHKKKKIDYGKHGLYKNDFNNYFTYDFLYMIATHYLNKTFYNKGFFGTIFTNFVEDTATHIQNTN